MERGVVWTSFPRYVSCLFLTLVYIHRDVPQVDLLPTRVLWQRSQKQGKANSLTALDKTPAVLRQIADRSNRALSRASQAQLTQKAADHSTRAQRAQSRRSQPQIAQQDD
jgi:hypothetical protein